MPGSSEVARRELYDELPSTQDRAIELARDGAEEGSVVVARRQRRGRGRGDRAWESPAGGLYLSLVLRPAPPGALLPLALGAELAQGLAEHYGVRPRLKWPNDLLWVDGGGRVRKLAGILADRVATAGAAEAVVVGVGINVHEGTSFVAPEVRASAVSLEAIAGRPVQIERLEEVVVRAGLAARRGLAEVAGGEIAVPRARGLLYGLGEPVTVDGTPVGTALGLRADGALEVTGPAGRHALVAGDVRVGVGS